MAEAATAALCEQFQLHGLQAEVQIYRDQWGVPHIYAQNQDDLFFAQGYVHAQDRFWQMEFWRHVGAGRISEIAGAATLDTDRFIRTLGWNRMAAEHLAYLETEAPELLSILEAYSAGVNAYILQNEGQLSINQTILGLVNGPWEIEPWTPYNTLTWGLVMSYDLGGNWEAELARADLIKEVGQATTETLLPGYPFERRPVIAPSDIVTNHSSNDIAHSSSALSPCHHVTLPPCQVNWQRLNTDIIGAIPPDGFVLGTGEFTGSNNWVIGGEHTATGMPLLGNDPHLGIQMPSIWYQMGLHAPGWNVSGFSFAGAPGIIIGHNNRIAWGVTNLDPDVQDLFIEKINPNNANQYEFMGEWQEMEVIEEVIKVNGGEDVVLPVRITRHGPIINEVVDGQSDVLAFRWAAEEPNQIFRSIVGINQAQNYEAFREAARFWDIPAQNLVYADVEGNIAYQMPGLVPIRLAGDGMVPVPGWTGEYEWDGWVPFEELPALLNPEAGYIVTANNAVVDEEYPYLLSTDWSDGDRARRMTEMIEEAIANGEVTAATAAQIQFDSKSLLAESYVPLFTGLSSSDPQVQAAIERLRGWDLQERRDSVPAALFEIFYMHLVRNVLADEVGEANVSKAYSAVFFHDLANQERASWWDDSTTAATESRSDILLRSMAETIGWFEENLGGEMNDWAWGRIHQATFSSNPLGQSGVGPIEAMVNRGPFPADGGRSIVNANAWSWDNPAAVTGHVSMRMIVDLSDFDASQAVNTTGQSGHPYHPHYDDMIELWLNGQYYPMWFSQEAVEAAAVDHLILQPGE
jgi:penicillin amidase